MPNLQEHQPDGFVERLQYYLLCCRQPRPENIYCILLSEKFVKTQKPKVLIFDPLMLIHTWDTSSYDFSAIFAFPFSKDKFRLSDETFVFNYQGNKSSVHFYFERLSNLLLTLMPSFGISGRKAITRDDVSTYFSNGMDSLYLGCYPQYGIGDCSPYADYMNDEKEYEAINRDYEVYFKKIYDICKAEGIELILIKTISVEYWNNSRHNSVSELTKEYDLEFIDYNIDYEKNGFDLSKHFQSKKTLNAMGMEHTTKLIGKYLVENHPTLVNSEKSEEASHYYDNAYKEYMAYYNAHAPWQTEKQSSK